MADVAQLAGVGTASVDRVLNERGNASPEVSRRVVAAAKELGLRRLLPPPHRKLVRIDVVLARPELPLIARMNFEFRRLAASLERSIVVQRTVLEDERPETLAKALMRTSGDAVVSYMRNHLAVHAAVEDLSARGVPVVTVISDVPGSARIGYAGTDHVRAGRSAGYFLTRMGREPGPIVVLCNSLGFQSHADRVRGLTRFVEERAPGWSVANVVEGGDDRALSERRLLEAFAQQPDTVGIYNVGAANIGVARAIRADILPSRPVFVGHELTRDTAAFLHEGLMSLVIDQSPELQARRAVDLILSHPGLSGDDIPFRPEAEVPIVLYGPENVPERLPF